MFPWYYNKNTYSSSFEDIASQSGFTHLFIEDKRVNSDFWGQASGFVEMFAKSINAVDWTPLRVQANLVPQLKLTHDGVPHTDGQQNLIKNGYEWITGIVYLNESDGDTLFYHENKIVYRHSPVVNRCLWFDGNVVHSGSVPQNTSRRLILNINLEVKSWK